MLPERIDAEFSIASAMADAHNKRKRDFLRLASHTSIDEEAPSHKRTTSRNNASIFRAAVSSHDVEEREDPADDDDDELTLVNAYRSREEPSTVVVAPSSPEPLDLPSSPKVEQQCDYLTFSPVSSFFHPAILRATTICESASDIFCGDPPEVDSRPCTPQVDCDGDATEALSTVEEKKERERPSWLTGTPAFNWSIPSKSGSSPWTFQLGSS
ncbi:hypothetical protein ACHAWO_007866 [Cyclotella atomus]|jgi:hypothetical protein|uniref:Uncharacterized protein n=1 Tax=Cyclotella atomus TaxID=382360 RepID=A0ABD3NS50_9STRA